MPVADDVAAAWVRRLRAPDGPAVARRIFASADDVPLTVASLQSA
jgi:hypothetical protein